MSQRFAPLDLHVDSIIQQRLFRYNVTRRHRRGMRGQPFFWHADLPRMEEANYAGACLGIHYWPWESEGGWREMNRQIDYLDQVIARDPRVLRVKAPEDWARARITRRIALAPGIEGAHMLNAKIERVDQLARRRPAYMTLTHFSKNAAATPAMGRGANEVDGLTDFGRDLVAALEDADILVDVAHVNTPCVLDVCKIARRPLFCTHTGVRGVHNHARNISDAEIDAIAETDGVIGIIFAPGFLTGRLRRDSTAVVDHIEYVWDRVGVRHLAVGSDYDGWLPSIPNDMRDCRDIHVVSDELLRRGHAPEDVDRVMRRNALEMLGRNRPGFSPAP